MTNVTDTDTAQDSGTAQDQPPPALLFEMIRSFVTLASTLNLSHAVKDLNSTRQTVRRHIASLETAMGGPLFTVDDRRYHLTEMGESVLPDAKDILARGITWLRGQTSTFGHLQKLRAHVGDWDFYQQQQPLGSIWKDPSLLLRETLRAWAISSGEIEADTFRHVRPYLIIYRRSEVGWICVEFGEKSVYVNWFGLDFARSSIGRPISQMPAGEEFSYLIYQAFDEAEAKQMARLDHVFTRMPRRPSEKLSPVAYQRLILNGFFPDGSPAVMSLVQPVGQLNIAGLDISGMEGLLPMEMPDFTPEMALFEHK
ncbi:helix-turn-helix domain-containing protein [Sulfitobacter sp. JB4-11]|uniref:helix-turn-helix domain-containing protein n=1 Tax=Sulfitobacter rhodophyticola TaxID=3238304 RepID=UPI003D81A944